MSLSLVEVDYTTHENETGYEQDCIFATCEESGFNVGPVWGHGDASVKRALALLSESCPCGAGFHKDSNDL